MKRKKISRKQRLFNKVMNHITYPWMCVMMVYMVKTMVSIPYTLLTSRIAQKVYDSTYIPFDSTFDRFFDVVAVIVAIIGFPFFLKGMYSLKNLFKTKKACN